MFAYLGLEVVVDVSLISGGALVLSCGAEIVADEPYCQLYRTMVHATCRYSVSNLMNNNHDIACTDVYHAQEPAVLFVLDPTLDSTINAPRSPFFSDGHLI